MSTKPYATRTCERRSPLQRKGVFAPLDGTFWISGGGFFLSLLLAFALVFTFTPVPQALASEAEATIDVETAADGETISETEELTPVDTGIVRLSETRELTPVNVGIETIQETVELKTAAALQLAASNATNIAMTVPVGNPINFGASDAYDVAAKKFSSSNTTSTSSTIQFQNAGTYYARMTAITCTDAGATGVLTKADGTSAIDANNKIFKLTNSSASVPFGPVSGGNTVAASALGTNFDIPNGQSKTMSCTLDLSSTPVKSEMATQETQTLNLATVKYTFAAATTTITWNANGGSGGGTTTEYFGSSAKISKLPSNPTRTDYIFLGWYTATSGGTKVTAGSSGTSVPYANTTYYAQWKSAIITPDTATGTEASSGSNVFYLKNNSTKKVYSAADVKNHADALAGRNGLKASSDLTSMYETFVKDTSVTYGYNPSVTYTCMCSWGSTVYPVRIIGTCQDVASDGTTKIGLTFQFIDSLISKAMKGGTTSNRGGWGQTTMYTYLNTGAGYTNLASSVKSVITPARKYYYPMNTSTEITYATSNCFLASYYEHCGSSMWTYDWLSQEGTGALHDEQYDFYKAHGTINNKGSNKILEKRYNGSVEEWYERTCSPSDSDSYLNVKTDGTPNYAANTCAYSRGTVPCFCI